MRKYKGQVRDNVWYVVTPDPTNRGNHESWHVVIQGGKYDKLVGKYTNIKIFDNGKTINYTFHTKWLPPGYDDREPQHQFDDLIKEILVHWLRYAHKNDMVSYAPMTEEMREKGIYTVLDETNEEVLRIDGS